MHDESEAVATLGFEDLQKVLESLEELSVDVETHNWGPSFEFAQRRQEDAIEIIRKAMLRAR